MHIQGFYNLVVLKTILLWQLYMSPGVPGKVSLRVYFREPKTRSTDAKTLTLLDNDKLFSKVVLQIKYKVFICRIRRKNVFPAWGK